MAEISCNEVSFLIKKKTILKDITLSIQKGSITGILGLNGAGKSTLLSLIMGLRRPSEGTIESMGEKDLSSKRYRQRIGVVFQETALYEELTVFENLQFSASLYGVKDPKQKIKEVLDLLGLSDRAAQMVKTLSGGLRRRISIARSLLHDPDLFIIDEPTLGVDAEARYDIWSYLRLLKSQGKTIIVATNYIDEIRALCDRVAVLKDGRLVASESSEALLSRIGVCLDMECGKEEAKSVVPHISSRPDIMRADITSSGFSLYLKSTSISQEVIAFVLKEVPNGRFRIREPDLAEVFSTFEEKNEQ